MEGEVNPVCVSGTVKMQIEQKPYKTQELTQETSEKEIVLLCDSPVSLNHLEKERNTKHVYYDTDVAHVLHVRHGKLETATYISVQKHIDSPEGNIYRGIIAGGAVVLKQNGGSGQNKPQD